jgi:hypothetical protein
MLMCDIFRSGCLLDIRSILDPGWTPAVPAQDPKLPPKLEVLKVTATSRISSQLRLIIIETKRLSPSLRKVVLSIQVAAEEDVSDLRLACEQRSIALQVLHESAHAYFHGPPVWEIPDQMS